MEQIQNFETLAENALRRDALTIAEAGYGAVDTERAVRSKVQVRNSELCIGDNIFTVAGRKVFYVGVGKCAVVAGHVFEKILGDALTAGIALDVADENHGSSSKIEVHLGTHPLPSEANERGAKRIMEFLADKNENDLVLMLISGGGSTLLCLPTAPMTCSDESALFSALTARAATIQDINTVRKHISQARGGALAAAAYPAEIISLIVSDVPGNDIEYVASGPTVLDTSTVADARAVLEKYALTAITNVQLIETPKEATYFERVTNVLLLSNHDALSAMKETAEKRGYVAEIVDDHFTGEACDVGRAVAEKLHSAGAKTALLYAGESTVTLEGNHGAGGRNQEIALSVLSEIKDDELILSFASDGHDNTDHAGAIGDGVTRAHALAKNISTAEYLHDHRSYDFFSLCGDALVTGYTGSNVSDLIIALKK